MTQHLTVKRWRAIGKLDKDAPAGTPTTSALCTSEEAAEHVGKQLVAQGKWVECYVKAVIARGREVHGAVVG